MERYFRESPRPASSVDPFEDAFGTPDSFEFKARVRMGVAEALSEGRMIFHYQPVICADRPKFVSYFEMLARLQMPNGHFLPAGRFMHFLHEGELGLEIDRRALRAALQALAKSPGLRLSVNMSPKSMGDEEWRAILSEASRQDSGRCGRLIIEISEDMTVANAEQTVDFMNFVRNLGPSFALDDFGAGATGFRHFRDFRFDIVKIDGAFVQNIHENADAQILVECLIKLAQHFEMMITAERVEHIEEAKWLCNAGVDSFQGYLYGRPSPLARLPYCDGSQTAIG